MPDPYADFPHLRFDRPSPGVLRITLEGPGLNAVDHAVHRELADVWRAVDRDPETNVALLQGAGRAFSAGGSFDLLEDVTTDYAARLRILREARDIVFNVIDCAKPIMSPSTGGGGRRPRGPPSSRTCRWPPARRIIDGHTRLGVAAGDHAAICWPLLCGMARQTTCSPASAQRRGQHRPVSLCVDDDAVHTPPEVAEQLSRAQQAIRWTKHTLNHWYRSQAAVLDASLAYEFLGFGGPDAREGLASHREKREPRFDGPTSE